MLTLKLDEFMLGHIEIINEMKKELILLDKQYANDKIDTNEWLEAYECYNKELRKLGETIVKEVNKLPF